VVASAVVVLALSLVLLGGAAGWLLQRRAVAESEALRALAEAEGWQQQRRWPEARAAARRAEGLLTGAGGRLELRQRVSVLLDDLAMVERLEEIRVLKSRVKDDHFDLAGADVAYAGAFRDYGVDVEALGLAAGDWIRARSVRVELAAALDDWAMIRQRRSGKAGGTWQPLLAAARLADADPLRTQVRQALETSSKAQLVKLADAAVGADLPATTLYLVGEALRDVGATEQAVAVLRAGQGRYPGDFWLNHDLAFVLGNEAKPPQWDEAIRFYTAAVALRPQSPGAYDNLGEALWNQGRRDEAVVAYRKAIALMPEYAMAHISLSNALAQMGRPDEAAAALRRAIELKPNSAMAHAEMGAALTNQGRWDEAVASLNHAILLNPDYAVAYRNLGVTYRKLGRLDEARAAFHQAEVINAFQEVRPRKNEGATDFAQQAADYAKLIDVTPNLGLWLSLWEADFRSKQFDTALRRHAKAIEQNPVWSFGWVGRGVTFCELGEWAKASADFSRAVGLMDAPIYVWYFRALLCLRAGDADGYRKVCASMRERWGTPCPSPRTLWTCVMGPNAVGDPMVVANEVLNAVGKEPERHWYANLLGTALYRAGRYDAAAGQLARASTLNPEPYRTNMIYTWFFLAMTHHRLGHAQEARQWLDKALQATDVALSPSPQAATGRAREATDPAGGIPPNWNRTLTLQLFRREALETLNIETDSKRVPSQREVP
jgi:tetratricopeptide (TPR) repeat protein